MLSVNRPKYEDLKPWPHRASVSVSASALMLAPMLESGYDTDAWCGLSRYKSMSAISNINADADAVCSVWLDPYT